MSKTMRFGNGKLSICWLLLLLAVALGCRTDPATREKKKQEKEASTIRLHLEENPDSTGRNVPVPVFRESPVMVTVNRSPFLTEADVEAASIVEATGGFEIRLQFIDPHGVRMLELVTTSYKGQRIAIFSQFSDARWLAAPQITRRITDGTLVFTPDATQAETERIVRGLNNVVRERKKRYKY